MPNINIIRKSLLGSEVFKNRYSYLFDGVNEYVNVFDGKLRNDNVGTVTCWHRPIDVVVNYIYSQGGATNILIGCRIVPAAGNNYMNFVSVSPANIVSSHLRGNTILANNTWYHLVWTSDGSTITMYVNGVLQTITILGGTNNGDWFNDVTSGNPQQSNIGAGLYGGVYTNTSGNIDEVGIFDTNLSATQITEIYNNGKPKDLNKHSANANLVNYWRFDGDPFDGTNFSVRDHKGNNHGATANMEYGDLELDVP